MRVKRFRNNIQETKVKTKNRSRTSSALLIPKKILPYFRELTKRRNKTELLKYFLRRYKTLILFGQMKSSKKIKTLYQEKNQNLKRVGFKPENQDWIELGILATALGCSRTLVFTTFLQMELHGIGEFFELEPVKKEVSHLANCRANAMWRVWKNGEGFSRILKYLRV